MATNKTRRQYAGTSMAPLLAWAMLLWIVVPASGQTREIGPPIQVQNQDNDTTRGELVVMDRFLDSHPEIAEQLRKDPSLINNATWVNQHPALQEFLQTHPGVREEFTENPNAFMRHEERFDQREDDRDRDQNGDRDRDRDVDRDRDRDRDHDRDRDRDRDTTRRELTNMDRFLDSHREIAEQLRKDPSLINNTAWVNNHPALQEFLQTHPGVREEFRENPNAFMRQEERYDRREGDRDEWNRRGDRDDRGELTSFGQFLGGHSTVAEELSKNPSLANNKEYLANHPELGEYLKAHPAMTQQLAANPQAVMSSNFVMQASGMTAKMPAPKPKLSPNP